MDNTCVQRSHSHPSDSDYVPVVTSVPQCTHVEQCSKTGGTTRHCSAGDTRKHNPNGLDDCEVCLQQATSKSLALIVADMSYLS